MSDFTYEGEKRLHGLETYEWDNTWWEHAPDQTLPRVLFIGDSISCQHRRLVTQMLDGKAWVDGYGTSKAVDNPWFVQSVDLFVKQMGRCEMILFNNGLHGFHLSVEEYAAHYSRVLDEIRALYPDKPVTLVLTTPVRDRADLSKFAENNEQVIARNAAVRAIAAERGLPVLDYYAAIADHPDFWGPDGVHLAADGYQTLAKLCAAYIEETLGL